MVLDVSEEPAAAARRSTLRIDIGGGLKARAGWTNLDPVHGVGVWRRAAQDTPWPSLSDAVLELYSSHVMEHIPAGTPRITVLNEAWRVLQPGGIFEIRVPLFPRWEAIADPTHVSFWVPESFAYFTGQLRADADYGISLWELVSCVVHDGWELRGVLRKPLAASSCSTDPAQSAKPNQPEADGALVAGKKVDLSRNT